VSVNPPKSGHSDDIRRVPNSFVQFCFAPREIGQDALREAPSPKKKPRV
jgi:hypothetical protein